MKRPCALLVAGALLAAAGCCSNQSGQAVNPFMNSTLPPAGTVAQPPPGAAVVPAPVVPPTATPPPTGQFQPSSGFQFQGSSLERRHGRRDRTSEHELADTDELDAPWEDDVGEYAEEDAPIVVTVDPRDAADAAALAPPLPPPTVVRVLSPERGTLAAAGEPTPAAPPASPAVQQAGYVAEVAAAGQHSPGTTAADDNVASSAPVTPAVAVAVAEPPGRFSHADDYTLLEGRLEHSEKSKQWKLRYISLDGQSDDFGGSVVLAGHDMNGYREGDFVIARGQVGAARPQGRSFAPDFTVTSLAKQ